MFLTCHLHCHESYKVTVHLCKQSSNHCSIICYACFDCFNQMVAINWLRFYHLNPPTIAIFWCGVLSWKYMDNGYRWHMRASGKHIICYNMRHISTHPLIDSTYPVNSYTCSAILVKCSGTRETWITYLHHFVGDVEWGHVAFSQCISHVGPTFNPSKSVNVVRLKLISKSLDRLFLVQISNARTDSWWCRIKVSSLPLMSVWCLALASLQIRFLSRESSIICLWVRENSGTVWRVRHKSLLSTISLQCMKYDTYFLSGYSIRLVSVSVHTFVREKY